MKQNQRIRVGFGPSPTGPLHVGGVRTALFNWLFARHHGGTYLLRIEDTDRVRSTDEFMRAQLDAMQWLGLTPDEEPVIQSSRINRHQEVLAFLQEQDVLYEKEGALWFKVSREQESLSFTDLIRGKITVPLNTVDDFVVRRSDGSPIYNFCVVVDDKDMEISHVIRGEDHISNTIKQLLLYQALGWKSPQFAHLPLIVNASGAPLSKRDGITNVARYKELGYLPIAFLNYLVRLGWAHGDKELFSLAEMVQLFTLGGVGKKASVFDAEKLTWVNQQHIMSLSGPELLCYLQDLGIAEASDTVLGLPINDAITYLDLYKSRVSTVTELADVVRKLSTRPTIAHVPESAPWANAHTGRLLHQFMQAAEQAPSWDKQALLEIARGVVKAAGVGLAQLGQPLRFSIVGTTSSPGIFDIMAIMGRDECLVRLRVLEDLLRASA